MVYTILHNKVIANFAALWAADAINLIIKIGWEFSPAMYLNFLKCLENLLYGKMFKVKEACKFPCHGVQSRMTSYS